MCFLHCYTPYFFCLYKCNLSNQEKETNNCLEEAQLEEAVEKVFHQNRRAYGSRRIKERLDKKNLILSRRKIRRIMRIRNLQSSYTKPKYRVHSNKVNQKKVPNCILQDFFTQ